jgi:hypothetical protein
MLGPIMPALGGGNARRPLALASRGRSKGDSCHEATDPQGHGKRLIVKKTPSRRRLKTERKMMKLKVQSGEETRFDQPVRRTTRTLGAVVARHPGFVAHTGNRRTAAANQARIDLWNFFGSF